MIYLSVPSNQQIPFEFGKMPKQQKVELKIKVKLHRLYDQYLFSINTKRDMPFSRKTASYQINSPCIHQPQESFFFFALCVHLFCRNGDFQVKRGRMVR